MKTQYCCSNCGSTNVEVRCWINPNELEEVDFSTLETGFEEDYWCNDCEEHYFIEEKEVFEKGDKVNYENKCFHIAAKISDDMYLIENKYTETEVYKHELKLWS